MQDIVTFIKDLGFPMFVAIYVLVRLEPTIRELQKTNSVLAVVLAKSTGVDIEEAKKMAGFMNEKGGWS